MITSRFVETMALYNQWPNETLFHSCDEFTDEQLRLNRGMFFHSIFQTLNHVIHVDQTIKTFIHTQTLPSFNPNFIPCYCVEFRALNPTYKRAFCKSIRFSGFGRCIRCGHLIWRCRLSRRHRCFIDGEAID